jgi:hypothetical protein
MKAPYGSLMKDPGNRKGKNSKPGTPDTKTAPAAEKGVPAKAAPLTAKEKIAANQKNKRRK